MAFSEDEGKTWSKPIILASSENVTYAEKVREIAKAEAVPLIDVYELFNKKLGTKVDDLLLDGVHPNDKGQPGCRG